MNVEWIVNKQTKEKMLNGELNIKKEGPLGIGIRFAKLSNYDVEMYVDVENSKGYVYGSYGPITMCESDTFHLQNIVHVFRIKFL